MPENRGRPWQAGGGHDAAGSRSLSHSTTAGPARQGPVHGVIRGTVWRKQARKSVHQLKAPPAWALDLADLDRAAACGCVEVHIFEAERGVVYTASTATIRSKGFEFDRGAGPQIALPLGHWRVMGAPEPTGPVQLSLFGGVHD